MKNVLTILIAIMFAVTMSFAQPLPVKTTEAPKAKVEKVVKLEKKEVKKTVKKHCKKAKKTEAKKEVKKDTIKK